MSASVRRLGTGVLVALILVAALAGCAQGSDSLENWADGEFNRTNAEGSTARYTDSASPSAVAKRFVEHQKPIDRHEEEGRTFLRYRDDIVAIFASGSSTAIEIDGSRTGRQRHFIFIGGLWGSPSSYTDTARGGGPGSGK